MCRHVNIKLILSERRSKNWTQQQLADMCGLSLRTIQRIEKTGILSEESLASLSSVLEIEKTNLLLPKPALFKNTRKALQSTSSMLELAKNIYSHLLIICASLLFVCAYVGLANSELDSREWFLIACISGACSAFVLSFMRRQ